MSKKEIEELQSLVLSERSEKKGPFSGALRDRLNTFLRARAREGESLQKVGAVLGLNSHTVQHWKSRGGESAAKLRGVKVVFPSGPCPEGESLLSRSGQALRLCERAGGVLREWLRWRILREDAEGWSVLAAGRGAKVRILKGEENIISCS